MPDTFQDCLMTTVHAIEISNGDDATTMVLSQVMETSDYFHLSLLQVQLLRDTLVPHLIYSKSGYQQNDQIGHGS